MRAYKSIFLEHPDACFRRARNALLQVQGMQAYLAGIQIVIMASIIMTSMIMTSMITASMNLPVIHNQLNVKVIPNSSKTEIISIENGVVKIRIAAPPDKGKANSELLKFLKKECGLKFSISSGAKSREKILELA